MIQFYLIPIDKFTDIVFMLLLAIGIAAALLTVERHHSKQKRSK